MSWEHLDDWWLEEMDDPAYESEVTPVLGELLGGLPGGGLVVDLGSGTGRLMGMVGETLGADVVGIEVNRRLASGTDGRVVVARLPGIPLADGSVDGAYAVLVLEHLEDHRAFFTEAARVVRSRGFLAVVSNHPAWTAPDSTPVTDTDGEVLWRPGDYFGSGSTAQSAGEGEIVFFHRSMSDLLNTAAGARWSVERMVEKPHEDVDAHHGIPRLIGIRWRHL